MTSADSRGARSSIARDLVLAVLFTIAGPGRAPAQLAVWIDGTGTRIAYSGVPGASAVSISPTLQVTRPLAWFAANGSFSRVDSEWILQGTASGSLFTRRLGGFQMEGSGLATGSRHEDGTSTNAVRGRARLHWSGRAAGFWAGGQLGTAANSVHRQSTRAVEAGAWARTPVLTLVVSAAPAWIGDSLRYLDGDVTARLVRGNVELAAVAGLRHWREPDDVGTDAWAGAGAVVWLNRYLAIVGGGGSYLADYAQGFPGGSYVTLGIRVATRRPAETEPTSEPLRRVPLTLPASILAAFEVRTLGGDRRAVWVRAPGAGRVELMGEFTGWQPVSLQRRGGTSSEWSVVLVIPPGIHRMNIRIDDGPWGVPPGVTALDDDFGPVGILKIGE